MKTFRKSGIAALSLVALSATSILWAQAQPAEKPAKPAKAAKPAKEAKKPTLSKPTTDRLELIAGKPLTDEQKDAALAAENEYKAAAKALADKRDAAFATALGITIEQMETAEKEARQKAAEERKAAKEAKKKAAD